MKLLKKLNQKIHEFINKYYIRNTKKITKFKLSNVSYIKRLIILLNFSLFCSPLVAQHHLKLTAHERYYFPNSKLQAVPGDTIVIEGEAESIVFQDILGTKEKPIYIINKGLVKFYPKNTSFVIRNCRHLVINGMMDSNYQYGILITALSNDVKAAINIEQLSTYIEICGIEVAKSGFAGIMAKTNPSPNKPASWRGNFILQDLKIHHNYIHHTGGEGMYLGYHTYGEKNGLKAHAMKNTQIYSNVVEYTGWDGIQLGCGDENSQIYDNTIRNTGQKNEHSQRSAMSINSGFNGKIYNNYINAGLGNGINVVPLDSAHIFDNKIENISDNKYGIYLQISQHTNDNVYVLIENNSINAGTGLFLHNKAPVYINKIIFQNNTLKVDTEIGYNYKRFWSKSFAPDWFIIK